MKKNTTPKSKWYADYEKEYKRVTQAIRRQKKLGYVVPEELTPVRPSEMPKILKKDVTKLTKVTPERIRKKSYGIDTETGEPKYGLDVVKSARKSKKSKTDKTKKPKTTKTPKTSTKRRKTQVPAKGTEEVQEADLAFYPDDIDDWEPQHRQYYPGFANIAITGYLKQLEQFPNAEGARILSNWLSRCIDKFGRERTAQMLDEGSRNGNIVTWETVYKGGVQAYITDMLDHMPEITDEDKAAFGDIMEEMESWEAPT